MIATVFRPATENGEDSMGSRAWHTIIARTPDVVFSGGETHSEQDAIRFADDMGLKATPVGPCSIQEAFDGTRGSSRRFGIGAYPEGWIVIGSDFAHSFIYEDRASKHRLARLGDCHIAAVSLHSVSNYWAYALYANGALLRASAGGDGEWNVDIGAPIARFEPALLGEKRIVNGEERYFPDNDPEATEGYGAYEIGDEAGQRILSAYIADEAWHGLRCTLFEPKSLLARLLRR